MGILRGIAESAISTHIGNKAVERSVNRGNLYALEAELARVEREYYQEHDHAINNRLLTRKLELEHLIWEEKRRR